jgi:hypothetical protein
MKKLSLELHGKGEDVLKELKVYFGTLEDKEVIRKALAISKTVISAAGNSNEITIKGPRTSVNLKLK